MSQSKGIQGAQQGLGMASSAASAIPVFGSIASGALDFLGGLLNIKGPKQKREEARQQRDAASQSQLSKLRGVAGPGEQNAQVAAGGGTLPLPSPPVAQAAPMQLQPPPQVQLRQPGPLGGQQQQQGPLGGQRNNYMMKMLMQGNR